jgi:cytochrome oxidase Cu insertion factor (SCO1/SenC/PrrC family)
MRSRVLLGAAIALVIAGAACSGRQETPQRTEEGPIAVGRTAPVFSLSSASGGTVSLSDYAGRPVLLYFSMGPG